MNIHLQLQPISMTDYTHDSIQRDQKNTGPFTTIMRTESDLEVPEKVVRKTLHLQRSQITLPEKESSYTMATFMPSVSSSGNIRTVK